MSATRLTLLSWAALVGLVLLFLTFSCQNQGEKAELEKMKAKTQDSVQARPKHYKVAEGKWIGAISPDGTFFTYTDWSSGDLAVHDLETGESRRLTHKGSWTTPESAVGWHAISPDSRLVAYCWRQTMSLASCDLRLIDLEGSEPRSIYHDEEIPSIRPQDWTRDGQHLLATFVRKDRTSHMGLVSVADGSVRVLKTFGAASEWDEIGGHIMALSPDERFVVYDVQSSPDSPERDIHVLSVDGSSDSPLVEHVANDYVLGWAPQGDRVLFASDRAGTPETWSIQVADGKSRGEPTRVDVPIPRMVGGFSDDGSYYYSDRASVTGLYIATIDPQTGKTQQAEKLVDQVSFKSSAEFSPDGRYIAYASGDGRYPDPFVLGIRSLETGEEVRHLLDMRRMGGHTFQPRWSPDGEAFVGSGRRGIVQIDVDSGETTVLVERRGLEWPVWGSDGKVIFIPRIWSSQGAPWNIVVRDLATGRENEIHGVEPPAYVTQLSVSPDGQQVAFVWSNRAAGMSAVQVIGTAVGGELRELLRVSRPEAVLQPAWSPDGRYVLFARIGAGRKGQGFELWRVSSDGGEPESLGLVMEGLKPWGLSVHPDGRRIAFTAAMQGPTETWVVKGLLSTFDR